MKESLKGYFGGFLTATILLSGVAYATTGTKTIEVTYDNIKVYKDNVLCELKDSNGSTVEPFIYNGTTYMPVRGTANLADMQVTWDGESKSVYLWDEKVPEGTSFIEACPPYGGDYSLYSATKGNSFNMAGEKYSDGVTLWWNNYALFNLNSKYSELECTVGHNSDSESCDQSVSFIVDGKVVKTIELEADCLPKKVSIPLKYGLQLKILHNDSNGTVGIGNMSVK